MFSSLRTVSNQASPSRPRPSASHSGRQRRRQCQRQFHIGVFPTPPERGTEVVDLDFGLLDALLIITARPRVEQGGHRRVVVAVARTHGIRLAGFAEFFQRVLAHSFEQSVSRSAPDVFGDD